MILLSFLSDATSSEGTARHSVVMATVQKFYVLTIGMYQVFSRHFKLIIKCQLSSGVASYGALGHVPPRRLRTISFLVYFGVNQTANYPCIVHNLLE